MAVGQAVIDCTVVVWSPVSRGQPNMPFQAERRTARERERGLQTGKQREREKQSETERNRDEQRGTENIQKQEGTKR